MKTINVTSSTFVILLISTFSHAQINNNSLGKLISEAITLSPKIKMIEAKIKSAENQIPQKSNLPDPQIKLGIANLPINSFSFSQEPMTGKVISLSQGIPFPGKLDALENVEKADVEIIKKELEEVENEIRLKVISSYLKLSLIREKIRVLKEKKDLFINISEVAGQKYAVGQTALQNVFKIELEQTRIEDKLEDLYAKERIQLATINTLLFRGITSEIIVDAPTMPHINHQADSLINIAKDNRPILQKISLLEGKSKRIEALSDYEFLPDFNLTLQYSQRDKIAQTNTDLNDFLTFMVGFNLPINYGGKKTAKIDEAKSMQMFYQQQYESSLQLLKISLETSLSKLSSLKDREKLYKEGLLIQASEAFNSSLADYQVGKVDFLNVIDALNKLLDLELKLIEIQNNYSMEVASIEFLTGKKFLTQ